MRQISCMPIDGNNMNYDGSVTGKRLRAVAIRRNRLAKANLRDEILAKIVLLVLFTFLVFYITASAVLTDQQVTTADDGTYIVTLWGEDYIYE